MRRTSFGMSILLVSVGLAVAAASAARAAAQQPAVDCRAVLEAYVRDKSLNVRREGDAVVVTRAGIEYTCRCYTNTFPPVCRPGGSFVGAVGLGATDLSRLEPGQQIAVTAVKTLIQALFGGIYETPSTEPSSSAGDDLQIRQDMLGEQEEAGKRVLESWALFRKEEEARLRARPAASDVDALVGQYGALVEDLLEISRKLAEVRRQRLDAAVDLREAEASVADLGARAVTGDPLDRALASKEEARVRLKITGENENACLEDAERAGGSLKGLDDQLKKIAEGRGKR